MDDIDLRIIETVRRRVRPYTVVDISVATKLSKDRVRRRVDRLVRSEVLRERWVGLNEYLELGHQSS